MHIRLSFGGATGIIIMVVHTSIENSIYMCCYCWQRRNVFSGLSGSRRNIGCIQYIPCRSSQWRRLWYGDDTLLPYRTPQDTVDSIRYNIGKSQGANILGEILRGAGLGHAWGEERQDRQSTCVLNWERTRGFLRSGRVPRRQQ